MIFANKISNYPIHWALGGNDQTGGLEQNVYELEQLCKFIEEKKIKTFLEIGMAQGLLQIFMRNEMNLDTEGINPHPIGDLVTYVGKSQDKEIIEYCKTYDLIFVDGDHGYQSVLLDYLNYKSKCKYMAFHDILGWRDCEGVRTLWNEIKKHHKFWEFIHGHEGVAFQTASGIGVIEL